MKTRYSGKLGELTIAMDEISRRVSSRYYELTKPLRSREDRDAKLAFELEGYRNTPHPTLNFSPTFLRLRSIQHETLDHHVINLKSACDEFLRGKAVGKDKYLDPGYHCKKYEKIAQELKEYGDLDVSDIFRSLNFRRLQELSSQQGSQNSAMIDKLRTHSLAVAEDIDKRIHGKKKILGPSRTIIGTEEQTREYGFNSKLRARYLNKANKGSDTSLMWVNADALCVSLT